MRRPPLTISLAELAALIRARATVVFGVALVVMGAVLARGYGAELVFVARGQLFLGEVVDASAENAASHGGDGVSGEMEILASISLVERAALAAGLNATVEPGQSTARYSEWLAAGRDYGALQRADNELEVADARIAGQQPESFAVELLDDARYRVFGAGGVSLGEGRLGQAFVLPELSWTLLPGPERRPPGGARYTVAVAPSGTVALEAAERLRLSAPRASGSPHYGRIVSLEFTAGSPHRAQRFLEALLAAYIEHRQARKLSKLRAREAHLEGESRSVERALSAVEQRLARLRAGGPHGLWLDPRDRDNPLLAERDRFQAARIRAMLEVARLLAFEQSLAGGAPPLESFLGGESDDLQLEAFGAALAEAQRSLTEAEQAYAERAPELREHQVRVAELKRSIRSYIKGRLERAEKRQVMLDRLLAENGGDLAALESSRSALAELLRDQAAYAETYTRLLSEHGEAGLTIAGAVSKDRIVDPPRAVAEPASPNLREALSSGLFGLFLGILTVLFQRLTAGTVQAESDARKLLGSVPVLAVVPPRARWHERPAALADVLEQSPVSGQSAFEEAFRLLGMKLFGALGEPRQQLIFITSPGVGDGKTTCALWLGLALARRGRRVLVVDGSPLELAPAEPEGEAAPGLEDVLLGRTTLRQARRCVPAGAGELHLLTAGTAMGEPRASADQLAEFLELSRARYDAVLVDAPAHVPCNAMAAVGRADRVLLAVRLRHTVRAQLDERLGVLPRARLEAVVLEGRTRRLARLRVGRFLPWGKERAVVPGV